MASVTKTQLKSILKECIEELIDEGAFNDVIKESVARYSLLEGNSPNRSGKSNPSQYAQGLREPEAPDTKQLVQGVMSNIGQTSMMDRNILQSIFEDTASRFEPTDEEGMPMSAHQPTSKDAEQMKLLETLTGPGRWAEIAFGSNK